MESKISIFYKKAKKIDLEIMDSISEIQSYNPIYSRFFEMDETNYNRIALNHKYQIHDLKTVSFSNFNNGESLIEKDIFVKFSPLLDPLNYLRGKYDLETPIFKTLPKLGSTTDTCLSKVLDVNNSSYVDGFFSYLSSMMKDTHNLVHGVEYYGSALAIQKDFKYDIADDMDFLTKCPFFVNNINKHFTLDEDASIILREYSGEGSRSNKKKLSIKDLEVELDLIELSLEPSPLLDQSPSAEDPLAEDTSPIPSLELEPSLEYESTPKDLSSSESDSSSDSSSDSESDTTEEEDETNWETDDDEPNDDEPNDDESNEQTECSSIFEEDEKCFSYLKDFPVQLIFQEKCKGTFDELIMMRLLKDDIFIEVLLQIVLILTTYQKVFDFTHNDLHTNNIMYVETDEDFLYYKIGGIFYKVPTNGRIFKLIDFGRAIYKFNNKTFCSDSFSSSGDAATQYNCEPYYNENKPKINPNPSFDLCRLGCSLYDFVCRDDKVETPLQKLVDSWCNDDSGKSVLYKSSGQERYPDFKLYKMIARTVNNLVPVEQLKQSVFSKYAFEPTDDLLSKIIDIDALPNYA